MDRIKADVAQQLTSCVSRVVPIMTEMPGVKDVARFDDHCRDQEQVSYRKRRGIHA